VNNSNLFTSYIAQFPRYSGLLAKFSLSLRKASIERDRTG